MIATDTRKLSDIEPVVLIRADDTRAAFAQWVRVMMAAEMLSISDLSRVLGVSRRTARRLWTGDYDPCMFEIMQIAMWFGLSWKTALAQVEAIRVRARAGYMYPVTIAQSAKDGGRLG